MASELGTPVALKINSAQVTHKSDIGGVLLNLSGDEAVRAGYEQVVAAAKPHQGGNEVLVTSMRTSGAEVLAGVTVDPAFGPVLAVGTRRHLGRVAAGHQPAGAPGRRGRSRGHAD